MNCTKCDYPLWNIKDRRCPECGQEFAPSQFKFVPRSVRFCCPHCEQHYFGTGVDGHLVPRTFNCVTCGTRIDMDEMLLVPAEGLEENHTRTGMNPWIDKRRSGFFGKWFATMGRGLFSPGKLIEQTPVTSSVWSALWFAVFTSLVCILVSVGAMMVLMVFMSSMTGGAAGGGRGGAGGAFFGFGGMLLFLLVASAVWLVIWLCLTHFILAISGPTAGGFRRTAQCMGYSAAPQIIYLIPCLSFYLSPVVMIWQVVSGSIMLARSQKVSGLRATTAMLTPPLLLGAGIAAFIIWVMVPAFSVGLAAARGGQTTLQGIRAQTLSMTLESARSTNGAYPKHAVELMESGQASPADFVTTMNPLDGDNVPVGMTTLGLLEAMSPSQRTAAIQTIIQTLPASVIAHRVGSMVFTYHGVTPTDRGLWVFIAEPPPSPPAPIPGSQPPPAQPSWMPQIQVTDSYSFGLAGGGVSMISKASFPTALAAQNTLRQSYGLPPLPDPSTVTSSAPALGPK